ncbi:hypothetical protein J2X97_000429 [Epilithonimonas hungarica]|uniref:AVAST type 2 anti-phage system protein Avs2 n=1 Tax=Epilithonimonas hungarica TaxID=454006 RepID=UPI002789C1E0|nr:AVAST type 2 anti-phage system protein Avs2 [Epilithonimonas hungarica]MDP9954792.1 hypothetical protein [Epilithonimonas hungarica]
MQNFDWNNIRPLNNSQKDGFEELVCQLARNDKYKNTKSFVRKGSPDAGVECFWILNDDTEICYQAKFFTSPLTSTQWTEIDESIKTALEKHPNVIKYIVSIPQDRADARVQGRKSFLDKWNESVTKWEKWAKEKSKVVEFVYEGSSELLDKLTKPENIGKNLFWFNKDEYSDDWFFKQNKSKIEDLGVRYSPEINVELDIKYVFDGLYLNKKFIENLKSNIVKVEGKFLEFLNTVKEFPEIKTFSEETFNKLKLKTEELLNKQDFEKYKLLKNFYDYSYNYLAANFGNKYFEIIKDNKNERLIRQEFDGLVGSIHDVYSGLHNFDAKLADLPYLVIEGKAGIGKSHLIADIIKQGYDENQLSILLLGQHFYSGNVWSQIKNLLDIKDSKDEFLGAINSKAESIKSRIIIYIDAINEGEGKEIWQEQLNGLLEDIKAFPNIGLVITIRSTYKDIVLPDNFLEKIAHFEHRGFDNLYNATKVFFAHYNIQEPPIPILNPEFNNPLFLKLFCKGLSDNGLKTIPQNYDNLNIIFDYLIESVNKSLSKKFGYNHKDFNLVNEAIEVIVSEMIKHPSFQISRKDANVLFKEHFKNDVINSRNILRELINENILNENAIYNTITEKYDKEIVYFSYERLGDYLIAKTLLSEDIKIIEKEKRITSDCKINEYIKSENAININQSLIEAFSIIIPEKTDFELYELLENNQVYDIGEAFLDSLIWRNKNTIGEKANDYINGYITRIKGLKDKFLEILIQLSVREDHFLNSYYLDNFLSGMKMNQRDYYWTIFINDSDVAKLFIDWIFESKNVENFSEESKKLTSIILSWFLTSSNRELRDTSTKALVKIFQNNLPLLVRLIKFFKKTNDLYVIERIYAVAYGSVLRSNENKQIKTFANFIFNHVFKNKNPIEHHLIRDYARGVVEFANHKGLLSFDISDSRPPYKSVMPDIIPSENEVEKYNVKEQKFNVQNNLYELVMGYSDFARYTLGTNHFSKISNISVKSYNIFQEVYNSSRKNKKELDNLLDFNKKYKSEFIKQQWKDQFKDLHDNLENLLIALFKLSEDDAKILNDYLSKISGDYYFEQRFDISILQRLIITDVFITYGWKKDLFDNHDYRDLRESYFEKKTYSKHESIGKKYVLISYYKWLSIILDNYLVELDYANTDDGKLNIYTGAWATNKRDIDPTLLEKEFYREDNYQNNKITFWFPENNTDWSNKNLSKWVLNIDDLIHPKNLIDIKDEDNNEWLNLYSYPSWYNEEDSSGIKKQIWYHIKSFIINKKDKINIIKALQGKSFFNHQIPQERDVYEVYSREYFWSKAYEDCTYENHPETSDRTLHAKVSNKNISGYQTSMNYMWYKDNDFSLVESVSIKRPTKYLFNLLELHFKENEYELYNANNELIVFNPAIKFQEGNDCLLVNKPYLLKKLSEKNLEIIWLVLGAKEVIGSTRIINKGDINSVFYLNNELDIEGEFKLTPYKES